MQRKPPWLKVKLQSTAHLNKVNHLIQSLNLNTVCQAANCPNRLECFSNKTATFMILGTTCTRHCKFCNVTDGHPQAVDPKEAIRLAQGIQALGLEHAVITSVTRDDLQDQGAGHFKACILAIRALNPHTSIEVLTPDFQGQEHLIDIVIEAKPHVYNHNIETVRSLYSQVRPQASYQQSLDLLAYVKKTAPYILTKSGIMLGLGETQDQVLETLRDLRQASCDIVTIGQYLPPSNKHFPLVQYIHPDQFDYYEKIALDLGFISVASGPLVRSSYKAKEVRRHL